MRFCGVEPYVDNAYIPIMTVFLCLAFCTVVMRVGNRFFTTGRYWWDDVFLALSLCGSFAYSAVAFEGKNHGLGAEMWSIKPTDITHLLAGQYASQVIYTVSRMLLRHSIVLFYLRIFAIGNGKPIIIGTMIVNLLGSIGIAGLLGLQCLPVSYFWTRWDGLHDGYCISLGVSVWTSGIIIMILDLWVLLLPLPFVAKLQLSKRKRIGISFMLVVGVSIVAFSLYKFYVGQSTERSPNPPVVFANIVIWASLEMNIGIICACLPGVRLLISNALGHFGLGRGPRLRQSGHISLGAADNFGPTGVKKSGFAYSRGSEAQIRITTTVQQKEGPTDSETNLPLHAIELGVYPISEVRAQAWA
ncbi:hypothetical protein QBC35DRAFT_385940 [Podospora australis]|uniref:Rhodopsin domain-containing protein n=1 Tax=Podospora australis TaxID=1536484 RepID=A0AAN7AIA8_9PEZI|nr:hypothetical protein QBC35DRAFT_385940 [Podospora australis]